MIGRQILSAFFPWINDLQEVEEWETCVRGAAFFRFGAIGRAAEKSHPLFKFFPDMRDEVVEARYHYFVRFLGWKE